KDAAENLTAKSGPASATTDEDITSPEAPAFATVPTAVNETSITMTSTIVTDAVSGPVQYYFTCVAPVPPGGSDSGWQADPNYLNTGLTQDVTYTYTVKARDALLNETAESGELSETTIADKTPPTPNPPGFAMALTADNETEISMTAITANPDASEPVKYKFFCDPATPGGHDSNWQTDPNYTDTGLSQNTLYTYRVQMKDAAENLTAKSGPASATTEEDNTRPTPNPATFSLLPTAISDSAITMTATIGYDEVSEPIEYFFYCIEGGFHLRSWSTDPNWTDTGLTPSTAYKYVVQMRDAAENVTGGSEAWETTLPDTTAPTPSTAMFDSLPTAISETEISMTAVAGDDEFNNPVEYKFFNLTDPIHDSGWSTSTSFGDTGLDPNTMYTYTVQMRDSVVSPGPNVGTASDPASATTDPDVDAPTPDPPTWASVPSADSETEISMEATAGTDISGQIEYYFAEKTGNPGANDSVWQTSATYTDSDLDPNTTYTYTVIMRDRLGHESILESIWASATTEKDTTQPTPNPPVFAIGPIADNETEISMTAVTAGSDLSEPVEYYFDETSGNPGGTDSGWTTNPSYTDIGLDPNTQYTYT
ncbi:hypothetical protein LCGC14_2262500, partial [marine sediment metagenome]